MTEVAIQLALPTEQFAIWLVRWHWEGFLWLAKTANRNAAPHPAGFRAIRAVRFIHRIQNLSAANPSGTKMGIPAGLIFFLSGRLRRQNGLSDEFGVFGTR